MDAIALANNTHWSYTRTPHFSPNAILIADDSPLQDKVSSQYHSTKGILVEAIGDIAGSSSWKELGKIEHTRGEAEYNAAQVKAYAKSGVDRLAGKKDSSIGTVTDDRT